MLSLLRLARKQTNSSNPFRIRTFFFLSCSFETETINIRSYTPVGSLENHTRFQTKTAQKPYTDGAAHTYVAYIREYPPPPGMYLDLFSEDTFSDAILVSVHLP